MRAREFWFHGRCFALTLPQQRCIQALGKRGSAQLHPRSGEVQIEDATRDPGVWLRLVCRGLVETDGSPDAIALTNDGRMVFQSLEEEAAEALAR